MDTFDHPPPISINELYNFLKEILDEMLDAFDQGLTYFSSFLLMKCQARKV